MIKDVLLSLSLQTGRDCASDYAMSVCRAFGARVTGVALCYEPTPPAIDMGEPLPLEYMDAELDANRKSAAEAISRFKEAAQHASVPAGMRVIEASTSGAGEVFGCLARNFDISILGQASPSAARQDLVLEGALLSSGRPVLVVPYTQRYGLVLNRVMVCWDGSQNASRAINDALPFLSRAEKVEIVCVVDKKKENSEDSDIVRHLAQHGVEAQIRYIIVGESSISNAILSDIAETGADLLVMGGYGHSRFREFVLGGVTREILARMIVPTFLSH